MQTEQFLERLLERFANNQSPLVVWYDPDAEFAELLDELTPQLAEQGIEVLREQEGARFELKCRINALDPERDHVLLYRQHAKNELKGDWFADTAFWASTFQADFVSLTLDELNAADKPELREVVRGSHGFLAKKTNLKRLRAAAQSYATQDELLCAICAVALGKQVAAESSQVLVAYLSRACAEGAEEPLAALKAAGALSWFEQMVAAGTGYEGDLAQASELARHLFVSALAASVDASRLGGLERYVSQRDAQRCLAIARSWMAADEKGYAQVAVQVEEDCNIVEHLRAFSPVELAECTVFPCTSEVIALTYLSAMTPGATEPEDMTSVLQRRRSLPWYESVRPYCEALLAYAQMRRLIYSGENNMPTGAKELWGAYTQGLYQVDTWYRKFHAEFSAALARPNLALDDAFKELAQTAENLYKERFLNVLNESWADAIETDEAEKGYVDGIDRQRDFFSANVDSFANGKGRVFVIVSDALRYEVAAELKDRLEQETQGTAELKAMQSAFPSVTSCGMASLLPHGTLRLEPRDGSKGVTALLDGQPCSTTDERQAVLAARVPGAAALRASDFMEMRREERHDAVGAADVVYLYHNIIDAMGDDAKTEGKVFDACSTALDELCGMVHTIVGELRCPNVLITADHGFVYTFEPLPPYEKVSAAEVEGNEVVGGRRYTLCREGATSSVLMRVSMANNGNPELVGFSPRSCARILRAGAGERYVHGGLSLQEMCVPCIRFKNHRAGSKDYVEAKSVGIALLDATRTITNNMFTLRLYQKEPVGGKTVAASYELYLADDALQPISDVQRVEADLVTTDERERVFKLRFCLKAGVKTSSNGTYYLVAADAASSRVVWKEQFRVEIAFSVIDGFGW